MVLEKTKNQETSRIRFSRFSSTCHKLCRIDDSHLLQLFVSRSHSCSRLLTNYDATNNNDDDDGCDDVILELDT